MDLIDNSIDYLEEWIEFLSKLPKPVLIIGIFLLLLSVLNFRKIKKRLDKNEQKKQELFSKTKNEFLKFYRKKVGKDIGDITDEIFDFLYKITFGGEDEMSMDITPEIKAKLNDPVNKNIKIFLLNKKKEDVLRYESILTSLKTLEKLIDAKNLQGSKEMKEQINKTRKSIEHKLAAYIRQIEEIEKGELIKESPSFSPLSGNPPPNTDIPGSITSLSFNFSLNEEDKKTLDEFNDLLTDKEYIDKYNIFFKKIYKQYIDKNKIDENNKKDENLDEFIKEIKKNHYSDKIKKFIRQFGKRSKRRSKKKNSKKLKKRRKIRRRSRIA